jgi:hypothetical protein
MSHGDKSSMNTTLRPTNHLRIFMIVLLVLSAAQLACNLPLRQAKPLSTLPDLAISNVSLKMIGQSNTGCVDALKPYEVEVVVINQGKAPATGVVVERAPGIQATIAAIEPGKTEAVRFQANAEDGKYPVQVDPQNLVLESSESNNSYFFLAPTPTPPALCPTQPASTPGMNMLPVGLIYNDMNLAESWMVGSDQQLVKLFDGINLRISPDGTQWQRFGFASDPVWSPEGQHLIFIQWPSNADSYLAAKISMVDVHSGSTVSLGLPEGSIPTQWISK